MSAALEHRQPDRPPIAMHFAPEARQKLTDRLGLGERDLREWIDGDFASIGPSFPQPASEIRYADPTIEVTEEGYFLDIYRVPFRQVQTEFQSYVELAGRPPLRDCQTVEELDAFPWPTADMWDYSDIPARLEASKDKTPCAHSRGFFEIAHFMRGMDNFLMDLALNPDLACALMDHIADYLFERTRRILEAGGGRYVICEYNDDIASQRGLMISPGMWREHIKPRVARFCDLIQGFGAKVRYHCCGSLYAIIGELIEIGVEIIHPVQPLATDMDPFKLKAEFGTQLCFHGGIDTQELLPNASADEVRRQVRKMIDVVGTDGGYILAPSHSIQADVPVENVIAMVQEAQRKRVD